MNETSTTSLSLTWLQKILYVGFMLLFSAVVILYSPLMVGTAGTVIFVLFGLFMGLITWFVSAAWAYRLELTDKVLQIRDSRQQIDVPLEKIGALLRKGGFPFPTLWLVLRNSEKGMPIPGRGVDLQTLTLIESYQKRNPGKKLTVITIPGGYLRSVSDLATRLKGRIPALLLDERLLRK